MEETKVTAKLPNLDVEMTRHALPERNAETITLRMTATPSFEAFGDYLVKQAGFPFGPLGAALMTNPWATAWANPLLAWTRLAQAAWTPLLPPTAPQVTQGPDDDGEGQKT